jgi:hypothetical protein
MIKVQMKDIEDNRTGTPVFKYCRKLIKEGTDPEEILEVYGPSIVNKDQNILYLRMPVGIGAKLTVDQDTTTFAWYDNPSNRLKKNQASLQD